MPSALPARYLRTLEYDPGGYDAASPPGGPMRGEPTDLLLGDLLYHSPSTLGTRARALGISCQTCHPNGAAHTTFFLEGLSDRPGHVDLSTRFFRPGADDGIANPVHVPSLRGARFTGPYGRDGRVASLSEFIHGVVTSEFGGEPLAPRKLAALVRYVQDLDFLPNANLDVRSRLSPRASDSARRGEAVFMRPMPGFGGESCASCHAPSTFFRDGRVHRLGTEASPSPYAVDGGYETPTLLGTAETAPYFHDGRFASLREVVAWFDASYRLDLSASERDDLTAYIEAVGAVDQRFDDRPLARRLDQAFAYVLLVSDDDAAVRRAAIEAVLVELTGPPSVLGARVEALRARLARLRERAARGPIDAGESRALRRDLARFAADWGGAARTTTPMVTGASVSKPWPFIRESRVWVEGQGTPDARACVERFKVLSEKSH
jgi:cytochrome c peroxidase